MNEQAATKPGGRKAWADECDLVLKGGITSSVVYPLAICEIAKAFRLRSIGGTSGGAIAAAAAAAAETSRGRIAAGVLPVDAVDGFHRLERLPEELAARTPDGKRTRLQALFKPAPRLAAVFDVFVIALGKGSGTARAFAMTARLVQGAGPWPWLVFALALLPLLALPPGGRSLLPAISVIALASLLGLAVMLWRTVRLLLAELPAQRFGICSGLAQGAPADSGEALTEWLGRYLDELSGQQQLPGEPRPLTFGDLKAAGVDLQMMTTCLTLGRPFRLPFRSDELVRENNSFCWRREDFEALFPPSIVQWMAAHQRPPGRSDAAADDGLLRLPEPDDMPVLVALRMSLSFPLLLSAVPLYAIDYRRPKADRRREPAWFSDGGLASNFPIHFFDAPLPSRPTFGFDLGHVGSEAEKGASLPLTNNDARISEWRRFGDGPHGPLFGFLVTAASVAKDWNHESLSRVPGFRDRIGLTRLTARQGGLNLNMSEELIGELAGYGRELGQRFVRRFGHPDKWPPDVATLEPQPVRLDWENHQLIRLRLLLATLSESLLQLERVLRKTQGTASDYGRFLVPSAPAGSYRFEGLGQAAGPGLPATQAQLARDVLARLRETARLLRQAERAANAQNREINLCKNAPRPTPELKVRPRV